MPLWQLLVAASAIFIHRTSCHVQKHLLKINVMKLLYKKDYFTVTKPKLHILGSSFEEEFSITKPSESKMSTYNTCS